MKNFAFTITLGLLSNLLFCPASLQAADITMTKYYPSLSGEYDQLRFLPRSADLSNPCTIGTLYVGTTNILSYCHNESGNGQWGPISDLWTQNADDIYLTDTIPQPDLHIGIGTKTPEFKLSLSNDAGIIAKGTYGSGIVIPDGLSAASRFVWYPRKAAFRAGYVSGTQWDNASIGNYSAALGINSTASGAYSIVGGGDSNNASGDYSSIIGGQNNTASGNYSSIIGGLQNTASGLTSIVTAGRSNSATADYTTILGGWSNQTTAAYSTVSGGVSNVVSTPYSNINGGQNNTIDQVQGIASGYSVIGGGFRNSARNDYSVISGGSNNTTKATYASIGGGNTNTAGFVPQQSGSITGHYSRISGGDSNSSTGDYSTIPGGKTNSASGSYSTIEGGEANSATGNYSTVNGGLNNTASGDYATTVGGRNLNAGGDYSLAAGRGMILNATADRTFVWGYSDTFIFIPTADAFIIAPGTNAGSPWNPNVGIRDTTPSGVLEINAFSTAHDYINIKRTASGDVLLVKNNGYIGVNKPVPTDGTYVMQFGNANNAYLSSGGTWTNGSSIKYKENIKPLFASTAQATLDQLAPVTFKYKNTDHTTAGFIAEDVPEIVAMENRQALSSMDIIAVLTKVSQEQEQMIKIQKEKIEKIRNEIKTLKKILSN